LQQEIALVHQAAAVAAGIGHARQAGVHLGQFSRQGVDLRNAIGRAALLALGHGIELVRRDVEAVGHGLRRGDDRRAQGVSVGLCASWVSEVSSR
jgi:2,3-bisphosphoglycerate-independent phosphoglycerate mutase